MEIEFFDNPRAFLEVAGDLLAADPLVGSIMAVVTEGTVREVVGGRDSWLDSGAPFRRWWAVVRDGGAVVSAVMRTAPFEPWMTYSLPMTDDAARLLARTLHDRGEFLGGTNGALPGAHTLAEETARLMGGRAEVQEHLRLWECPSARVPKAPDGRLRRASERDLDLVFAWYERFHAEAEEQAGREPDGVEVARFTRAAALDRIRGGSEWIWELPDGTPAHLTGVRGPSYGVSRLGPVFTPKQHRGGGIASYVVAELTRRELDAGARVCLFTDQANPTSNRIYAEIGYEPVVDMAVHRVVSA